jgi:hypothetical protein
MTLPLQALNLSTTRLCVALEDMREPTELQADNPSSQTSSGLAEKTITNGTTKDYFLRLPNELIHLIFSYVADLIAEPPSSTKFHDEPTPELTRNAHQPVKLMSLVCHRWRYILLLDLFKYSRVSLNCDAQWLGLSPSLAQYFRKHQPRSTRATQLLFEIETTETRRLTTGAVKSSDFEAPMSFEYVSPEDSYLNNVSSEHYRWIPTSRGNVASFLKFVEENELSSKIKSLVVFTEREMSLDKSDAHIVLAEREACALWRSIFKQITLPRIVVAAPPSTMAILASSREDSPDTWAFEMSLHYLCFSTTPISEGFQNEIERPSSSNSQTSTSTVASSDPKQFSTFSAQTSPKSQSALHNTRPWRHLAYNEGTMINGYSHYEYQWKTPPKVFPTLLLWLSKEPRSPHSPQITSIEYTSLFPYHEHITYISWTLASLRNLQYLDIKFASPSLLDDPERLGKAQMGDVWANFKESYKAIYEYWLKKARVGTVLNSRDMGVGQKLSESIRKRVRCMKQEKTMVGLRMVIVLRERAEGVWVRDDDVVDGT